MGPVAQLNKSTHTNNTTKLNNSSQERSHAAMGMPHFHNMQPFHTRILFAGVLLSSLACKHYNPHKQYHKRGEESCQAVANTSFNVSSSTPGMAWLLIGTKANNTGTCLLTC